MRTSDIQRDHFNLPDDPVCRQCGALIPPQKREPVSGERERCPDSNGDICVVCCPTCFAASMEQLREDSREAGLLLSELAGRPDRRTT